MKYFWLGGYIIIMAIYGLIAYLLADYTLSDYAYWVRVFWCGVILSLMYLSVDLFQRKASHRDQSSPLFIIFTSKVVLLGITSIGICIRSYFYHPEWLQVTNLITQGAIVVYLILLAINLIFIGNLEKNSAKQLEIQRSYAEECRQLFLEIKSQTNPDNLRLFNSVKDLFDKTVLMVKTEAHVTRLNRIKSNLYLITKEDSVSYQSKILYQILEQINNFYR